MNKDCVSLELAKKLKEAGWEQHDDQVFWAHFRGHHPDDWHIKESPIIIGLDRDEAYAAPTIGSLLEVLKRRDIDLRWRIGEDRWCAMALFSIQENVFVYWDNPADALALLWLDLKEKNLV